MREHPTESKSEADAWSLDGDLLYRKEDKKPFLSAISAVEKEEKSLVVIGDEGVLDHYCRLLIGRLKDNEQFHLEVFLSTSKDGLLKRFNQMLANMSIDEARKPASADTSVHLLVINDASTVKEQEWTLLIRLIRDFPGANVRVALFVDKSSLAEFETRFDKLGRRVHRWTVHAPTLEEVRQLRQIGKLKGYSAEVEKMLLIAGLDERKSEPREPIVPEPIVADSVITTPEPTPEESIEEVVPVHDSGEHPRTTGEPIPSSERPFRRLLLLTLCLSASVLLLSQRVPDSIEGWSGFWVSSYISFMGQFSEVPIQDEKVSSNENKRELSNSELISLESINFSSDGEGALVLTLGLSDIIVNEPNVIASELSGDISIVLEGVQISTERQKDIIVDKRGVERIVLSSEDQRSVVTIITENVFLYEIHSRGKNLIFQLDIPEENGIAIESTTLQITEPEAVANTISDDDSAKPDRDTGELRSGSDDVNMNIQEDVAVEIENAASRLNASAERVLGSEDISFFIQHIVFSEIFQAEDFIASYEGLRDSFVAPIKSGDNKFVAVLSGPFDSREEAESWAKEYQLPADFWIRNTGLLKRVIIND